MESQDVQLIEIARELIAQRFKEDYHHIGAAATAGDTDIETIVAVNELGTIVSPCGMCRELISDYGPGAEVIIVRDGEPVKVPVLDLLPDKYSREDD